MRTHSPHRSCRCFHTSRAQTGFLFLLTAFLSFLFHAAFLPFLPLCSAARENKMFSESEIRNIMFQVLSGLVFVHKHGFFHRDMKPENLLCMGPELVKIADFGLAREIRSKPPYTDYVSTRWYRAPEVLLRSSTYSSPIDLWAVGCIMAELYTLRPLFPGNSEVDEIFKICQVLGTVKKTDWPEGYQLASAMNFRFPQCVPTNLKTLIPNASNEAITLMRDLLQWDPKKRPTAVQALRYPYFQVGQILGPRPHSQEVKKVQARQQAQKQASEIKTDPQQSSSESKASTSSTKNQQQHQQQQQQQQQQPLQQIPVPQTESKPGGLSHVKAASLGTENNAGGGGGVGALKSGRRRWGQAVVKMSDSWEESDPSDTAASNSKKPSLGNPEEERSSKEQRPQPKEQKPLYSFSTVTKLPSNVKIGQMDSGLPGSAARQHYLSQSRYLPGLIQKNQTSSGDKELRGMTLRDLWENSSNTVNKPLAPIGGGLSVTRANAEENVSKCVDSPPEKTVVKERILEKIDLSKGNFVSTKYNLSGAYVPSFQKKEVGSVGQRIQLAPLAGQQTSKILIHVGKANKVLPDTVRSDDLPASPFVRLTIGFKVTAVLCPLTLTSTSVFFSVQVLVNVSFQTLTHWRCVSALPSLLQSISLLLLIIKKTNENLQRPSPCPTHP
uniref:serine/threonine-protein kinase MAK isoform X4 n=1 Tax=Scatophagus argus TaxID=75038 RepID=UPI001ED8053B|nr:serine/threonine-protein kinase MAK isoform X4 [Scatophagus argus]